jgi:hypothetical protein
MKFKKSSEAVAGGGAEVGEAEREERVKELAIGFCCLCCCAVRVED